MKASPIFAAGWGPDPELSVGVIK